MSKPNNKKLLNTLKRGLSGYVSYLVTCQMSSACSEYILYEPILRIITALGCSASCEYPCHELRKVNSGDHKRIDIVAKRNSSRFAIEVKWVKRRSIDVESDYAKLHWFVNQEEDAEGFLLLFGTKQILLNIKLTSSQFREVGKGVYADFGATKYGCRIFEVNASKENIRESRRKPKQG